MRQTVVLKRTFKHFFKTTTLHGFKYLWSSHVLDSISWSLWCAVSACCAVALSTALWARYAQTPALLTARGMDDQGPLPSIAVCPSPEYVAQNVADRLSISPTEVNWLPALLNKLYRKAPIPDSGLVTLQQFLVVYNMSISQLLNTTSPCSDVIQKCRWRNQMKLTQELFHKELTQWGWCCVMHANRFRSKRSPSEDLHLKHRLILLLNCPKPYAAHRCEFFIKYNNDDKLPTVMEPGYNYYAKVTYVSEQNMDTDALLGDRCVNSYKYSRSDCLDRCRERMCGCSNPMVKSKNVFLPVCTVGRLRCLLVTTEERKRSNCDCPEPCKKVTPYVPLESSPLNALEFSFDPIYAKLNTSSAVVLNIDINLTSSKIFTSMATETWFTLMSSLGGVFNMFLGVGLFSALEIVFLFIVRLPLTLKRFTDMENW